MLRRHWRLITSAALVLVVAVVFLAMRGEQRVRDRACSPHRFEDVTFTVCVYDPRQHQLQLVWRDEAGNAYRGFRALAAAMESDADSVRFAMNAGMFDNTGAPIGLYVEQRETLHDLNTREGPGNFHMLPNGVFWLDRSGAAHVDATDAYQAQTETPLWATQSGPMLVIDGAMHPAFQQDGPSRYVRNGVGVSAAGQTYFVISGAPVSFGRFARFFRDELGCDDALFLDGGVSGLWAPRQGRMDRGFPLGPLLIVRDR